MIDDCIEAQAEQGDMEVLKGKRVEKQEYVDAPMYDDKIISKLMIFVPMKD